MPRSRGSKSYIWWFSINLMQANPEQFQLIFFNCKVESPVILDGCIIKPEKVVKLLGITIDQNFSFSIHTERICKKAGRQLSALRRLSFYLDSKAKLALFRAFILSHFQYCSAVWYHSSAPNARCMEKIQERALKCVYWVVLVHGWKVKNSYYLIRTKQIFPNKTRFGKFVPTDNIYVESFICRVLLPPASLYNLSSPIMYNIVDISQIKSHTLLSPALSVW